MFLDLANFTAWSSDREPHQVLTLLETLYVAFDDIAQNLGVFKVETIDDCCVAVAGLLHATLADLPEIQCSTV
jgi:class 3 adenylate cyclase